LGQIGGFTVTLGLVFIAVLAYTGHKMVH